MIRPTARQLLQLVGNWNAYAVQRDDGSYYPVRERLTPSLLQRHLAGDITIGTYFLVEDQAKCLVLDFDSGDEALKEAHKAWEALIFLGVPSRCVGIEFSGSKGYHVWLPIGNHVSAADLRRLGNAVLYSNGFEAEVYPKQDKVSDLGSLVKLPGGVHRKTGARCDFVDKVPMPLAQTVLADILKDIPMTPERVSSGTGPDAIECMAKIQDGIEEGSRNNCMFHLATMLRRGGLVRDELLRLVLDDVNVHNTPPLPAIEIANIVESSKTSGPICSSLPDDIKCQDCPVYRPKGLSVRPRQLRHAAEGERVVVEVGKRRKDGVIVELVHPDIESGNVGLK